MLPSFKGKKAFRGSDRPAKPIQPPDLRNMSEPRLAVCKAWSHTGRRHMLSLLATADDSSHGKMTLQAVMNCAGPGAFLARLAPLPEVSEPVQVPVLDQIARFLTISWAQRAPGRLRVESRPQRALGKAQDWGLFGVEDRPGPREILTLEALCDGPPPFSPPRR